MKLTLFLICVNVFIAVGSSYSQATKLTLKGKDVKLEDVIEEVKKKTEFCFFYNHDLVDTQKRVNYKVQEATVDVLLEQVLEDAGLKYEIIDKTIILSPKPVKAEEVEKNVEQPQKKTIIGKVTDTKGEPLPVASIVVKGTTVGVTTDFDGNYSLEIPDDAEILVFSFVGMITTEVAIGDQLEVNIVLEEDAIGIEEVVAIGYGTMKKSDLTGSVVSISEEDFRNTTNTSVDQMIQGKVAGLHITQTSGQPGAGVSIRIRGNSSLNTSNE